MAERIGNVWKTIWESGKAYFGGSWIWLFLAAVLAVLLVCKKEKDFKKTLAYPSLLVILVCFCPVTAWVLIKMIGALVYWRVFWMLPIVILVSFGAVELVTRFRSRGKQVLVTVICAVLIAVNGSFVFTDQWFTGRENNFKLPTEMIWVADAINDHAREHEIQKKKIAAPTGISTYVRIYDASISQVYGRTMANKANPSELFQEIHADEHDYDSLIQKVRKKKCRYLVLNKNEENEKELEARNFHKVYESPSYEVYFNGNFRKEKN